jgi:CMP-N-acetylneuraminic acid synthetase
MHALEQVDGGFDAVGLVQATSPFTAPEDLAGAVRLLEQTNAESVVSVVRVAGALHPLKLKVLEPSGRLLPYLEDDALTPSHELPPLWVRNGSIYLSRVEVIRRGALVSERDVRGYEMPEERSFDIDTPRDLALARLLAETGTASD